MLSGEAIVVTYDSTSESEDILWGFGLGCHGIVQVLIEPLQPKNSCHPLTILSDCWRDCTPCVIASVVKIEGTTTAQLGAHLALTSDKLTLFAQTDSNLTSAIASDAQTVLHRQQSTIHHYSTAIGKVQVFLEFIHPLISLTIFGAGQDVIPVAQFAKFLGWQVIVVDCRANPASCDRFAMADQVILTRREQVHLPTVDDQAIAVVMTHNYLDDLEILRRLLPSPIRYIGVLGPKRRTNRLLQELQQQQVYNHHLLKKLYAPVGLDIGAETPEAIALSILAEIQTVLSDRTGGSLKHRRESIHAKPCSEISQRWSDSASSRSFNSDGESQTTVGIQRT